MESSLSNYFRCPEQLVNVVCEDSSSQQPGYFRFGEDVTLFGRLNGRVASSLASGNLYDAFSDVPNGSGAVPLSFNVAEAVGNLQRELYVEEWRSGPFSFLAQPYYSIRPMLPVGIRRYLQKVYLRGWEKIPFPKWPVDVSVDALFERLLGLVLKATGIPEIPFIWFWPDGHKGCALMTHDVETEIGRDFCNTLMDIDDSFGVKASFQVIPEERYGVSPDFLESIRQRGHEIAIHDLNHDGHLYKNKAQFVERAAKINAYGKQYRAEGFRAGVLYRKQVWYDELKFAYDMSVPNVAHLDPQRGGCCTVMPYFIGDILEIPVTTIQDYTLFNILEDFSTQIWMKQTQVIREKFGLMSFIIHPDYVLRDYERRVYFELLQHIATISDENGVWLSTPTQVNQWWRQRAQMTLVNGPGGWQIQNPGDVRARVAYARLDGDRVVYEIEDGKKSDTSAAGAHTATVGEMSTQPM